MAIDEKKKNGSKEKIERKRQRNVQMRESIKCLLILHENQKDTDIYIFMRKERSNGDENDIQNSTDTHDNIITKLCLVDEKTKENFLKVEIIRLVVQRKKKGFWKIQ